MAASRDDRARFRDNGRMDVVADLACDASPEEVYAVVADLTTYPRWLDIVSRVELDDRGGTGENGSGWYIDLRGQIGPLRRSKRLRMVRAIDRVDHVRFERDELDGRRHSEWVLDAVIVARRDGCVLSMSLHYGGALWLPVLDRLLADEIERSRPRLAELLEHHR